MDTVDVTADSAFDIEAMQLTVNIVAKGASSQFAFLQAIFADAGPMTSDGHFSPNIRPAGRDRRIRHRRRHLRKEAPQVRQASEVHS